MRHALLFGNSRYKQIDVLKNPTNDAYRLAQQLRVLGFDVTMVENADYREMLKACDAFARRVEDAGDGAAALFYFAGHGIQAAGENFLLPIDVSPGDAGWLDRTSLSLDWLLKNALHNRYRQTRIAVIDACRNNPFSEFANQRNRGGMPLQRGLAQSISPPETLIAFSTSPGLAASDGLGDMSLYAAALIETIVTPGLPVETMFKRVRIKIHGATRGAQIPWEHSSLIDEFCFHNPPAYSAALRDPVIPVANMQSVLEQGISYPEKLTPEEISQKAHLIHKLKAKDSTGQWAYYFVLVPDKEEKAFLSALSSKESIDLEDFGTVIASNYGEEPSLGIKEKLKKAYGFDV